MGQIEKYTNGNNLVTTRTYDYKTSLLERIQTGTIQDLMYAFDEATGNLNWRMDNKRGLREDFGYDALNRLDSIAFNSSSLAINYGANGNISSKSDMGTYDYSTTQPHAISSLTPTGSYVPENQSATYTSFDKLATLTQGTKSLVVTYGYDLGRRKTVYSDGSTTKTKIFVPGGLEIIDHGSSQTEEYCYISTPAGVTAVYDKTNDAMFYVHSDHLGSIHFITNTIGNTEQELSFDAWGRQRNATNWTYSNVPEPKFERGYTFHEHLAEFGLINMNGRMYDPIVGRMLSPDPVLQNPYSTQNYNRYSYVVNNPLKYTDPSGYMVQFKRSDEEEFPEPDPMPFPDFTGGNGFNDIGPSINDYTDYINSGLAGMEGFSFSDYMNYVNEGININPMITDETEALSRFQPSYAREWRYLDGRWQILLIERMVDVDANGGATDWKAVRGGLYMMGVGTYMIGKGIAVTGTVGGAPLGIALIVGGGPLFGFGLGQTINGFQGNEQYIPGGLMEAIDVGFGGDGSTGKVFDVFIGGMPDSYVDWMILGYGIYKLNPFQKIEPTQLPYPTTQPRDNTNIYLPIKY
ncbi:MAG: RHS repeat domain-containing protein [Salinivirgaceae bacterium]